MPHWVRFEHHDEIGFGTLDEHVVTAYRGNMFENPEPTSRTLPLSELRLLSPTAPSKTIALWNNFHALAAKLSVPVPEEPLYLLTNDLDRPAAEIARLYKERGDPGLRRRAVAVQMDQNPQLRGPQ